jgi:predicted nucleic acid-binding protein
VRSAIDTNIISSLWAKQPASETAERLLLSARDTGGLVVCGLVYSELLACPGVSIQFVDDFLSQTGIEVEYELPRHIWQQAGLRFSTYARRRMRSKGTEPKRLLADFVIGAHALLRADRLLTFNPMDFRIDFPELAVD